MGKKKGKEKEKNKKQSKQAVEQAADKQPKQSSKKASAQPAKQQPKPKQQPKQPKQAKQANAANPASAAKQQVRKPAGPTESPKPTPQAVEPAAQQTSEESLANAVMAARESAKALQEAASAISQQMNAANGVIPAQQMPGYGANAGLGLSTGSQYGADGSVGAGSSAFGRTAAASSAYRSLGSIRRANKAQESIASSYPFGSAGYMHELNASMGAGAMGAAAQAHYGMGYQPFGQVPGALYQQGQYPNPYQAAGMYPGYPLPYGYGAGYDALQSQDQTSAAAKQVAAAQSAAFNAASQANSAGATGAGAGAGAAGAAGAGTAGTAGAAGANAASAMRDAAGNIYNGYNQNPAYAVNEDLLANLPKFGEPPYPLPEPHEILESVPSLTSLAFGATAAQMPNPYETAQAASADDGSANGQADDYGYDQTGYGQPGEAEDDNVIFAYVEDAGPIDLTDSSSSRKKKKKKQQAAEAAYAGMYGTMEEISIPAVYGDEDGFSVEIPMDGGESGYGYASQEVSAEYYEVEDADGSGYSAAYAQGQGAPGEYAYEGWTADANAYESYDGYNYDENGNVYYYDENGYPYYYDEYGNAYYYDNYGGYADPMMQGGKPKTGMVLSVLSIVLAFVPVVGLILGIIATKKAKKYINNGGTAPSAYTARLLGKLGIILSIVFLLVYVGLVVAYFLNLFPADVTRSIRSFISGTDDSTMIFRTT